MENGPDNQYTSMICSSVISLINNCSANRGYSINGKEAIYFKDMIKAVLDEVEGFRLFLQVSVFKFSKMFYQKAIGNKEFTTDQIDSLTEKRYPMIMLGLISLISSPRVFRKV